MSHYAYFARGLRGVTPEHREIIYPAIVEAIRETGWRPQFDINPGLIRASFLSHDEYVYCRDLAWITQCQVMIAEVTGVSHGVGYELCYMQHVLMRPVLCLVDKETEVSAMINGAKKYGIELVGYRDTGDLKALVRTFLESYTDAKHQTD